VVPPGELRGKGGMVYLQCKSCVIHAERFRSGVIHLRRYTNGIPFALMFSFNFWYYFSEKYDKFGFFVNTISQDAEKPEFLILHVNSM